MLNAFVHYNIIYFKFIHVCRAHQKLSLTPKDWSNFDYINVEFFVTTSDKKKIVTVPKIINQEEVDAQILNVHKAQYMCMALHNLVIFDK